MIDPPKSAALLSTPARTGNSTVPPPSPATQPAQQLTSNALIADLEQGQQLLAKVATIDTLNQQAKTLLQQVNPTLAEQLAKQLSQSQERPTSTVQRAEPSSSTSAVLAKATLHLIKLTAADAQRSNPGPTLTAITPVAVKVNDLVALRHYSHQQHHQLLLDPLPAAAIARAADTLIKQQLPQQQSTHLLHQWQQQLQQLPKPIQQSLLNQNTLALLNTLRQHSFGPDQLQQPGNIKHAIHQSGIFFEAGLAKSHSVQASLQPALSTAATSSLAFSTTASANNTALTDLRTTLTKLVQAIQTNQNGATHNAPPAGQVTNSNTSTQELDTLLTQLATAITKNNPTSASTHTTQPAVPSSTAALFKLLGLPLPNAEPSKQLLPPIVEQHLRQLVEKSQARLQLLQLRSLGLDNSIQQELGRTPLTQIHTELPLRFNEQVLPLQLQIQEQYHWPENDNSQENATGEQDQTVKRRWQVFMSFDLPGNETLYTQLSIIDDSVEATLWAESPQLFGQATAALQRLRDQLLKHGLVVEDLHCIQGKPPQPAANPGYHLVDIET